VDWFAAVPRACDTLAAKPPCPDSYCDRIANPWGVRDHAEPVGGMQDMTEGSGRNWQVLVNTADGRTP